MSSNYYYFLLLATFFHLIIADGIFEVNLIPKCKDKVQCNIHFKVCLRHYEKTVNYEDGCSFGETTISSNDYQKVHQIKFNFSWTRDFSLIVEGFNSQSSVPSERYAAKNRIIRLSFQKTIEVNSEWKEESFRYQSPLLLTTRMRVLCDVGFYGKDCAQKCIPRDDKYGHFECTERGRKCLSGWKGDYCDSPICAEGCLNGTCEIPGTCECNEGFEGVLCDRCKVYPGCQHGSCKKPWECNCDDGWGGSFCDKDLNYCTHHNPCANGICYNRGDRSYTCECIIGYTGVNCDIPVNDCSSLPCVNGGSCLQSSITTNYTCSCPVGFTGVNCESRITESPLSFVLTRSEKSLNEPDTTISTTSTTSTTSTPSTPPNHLLIHFTTPVPAPVSSFSSFERIISNSEMTLISSCALIIPLIIIVLILYRVSKQRIRVEERQKYENEEAIRQNEENSSKKCLENDLIYNDLNRASMRIIYGHHPASLSHSHPHPASLSRSHPHLHPSLTAPQCTSTSSSSSSSYCNNTCSNKLSYNNDDYIVNDSLFDYH